MKTIRISEAVWDAIASRGRFGETPDDVLRRVFKIEGHEKHSGGVRRRQATRRMSARIEDGRLFVGFLNGPERKWPLPLRTDKDGIRDTRDQAVRFASDNGATQGQRHAVMRALTSAKYHITK